MINDKNERLFVYGWWAVCGAAAVMFLAAAWFFLTKVNINVVIGG